MSIHHPITIADLHDRDKVYARQRDENSKRCKYTPTVDDIARRSAEVRAGWNSKTEKDRRVVKNPIVLWNAIKITYTECFIEEEPN